MTGHTSVLADRVAGSFASNARRMATRADSTVVVLGIGTLVRAMLLVQHVLARVTLIRSSTIARLFALLVAHATGHVVHLEEAAKDK